MSEDRRRLLKAIGSAPVVIPLNAKATLALQSAVCSDNPDSYVYDDQGQPIGLTASCMNSLGVVSNQTLING